MNAAEPTRKIPLRCKLGLHHWCFDYARRTIGNYRVPPKTICLKCGETRGAYQDGAVCPECDGVGSKERWISGEWVGSDDRPAWNNLVSGVVVCSRCKGTGVGRRLEIVLFLIAVLVVYLLLGWWIWQRLSVEKAAGAGSPPEIHGDR